MCVYFCGQRNAIGCPLDDQPGHVKTKYDLGEHPFHRVRDDREAQVKSEASDARELVE